MNKKLVAVAVAAVLAAPLAAQAQTANVTLYGRLNITLEYIDANGDRPSVQRLSSNSSRLGVRGTESLGGGLNAIFQIESSISGDAGGGTLAGRDTFVGLQGSWGTVRFGNFLAPYDDMHPIFGNVPTFTTSILSTASIWSQGTSAKAAGGFDARLGNSLRYDTPNIAGFVGGAQISLDSENGVTDPYVLSLSGVYNNGPFQGGIAYEYEQGRSHSATAGLDDWAATHHRRMELRHRPHRRRLRAPRLRHADGQPEARLLRRFGDGPDRPGHDLRVLRPCGRRQGWRLARRGPGERRRYQCRSVLDQLHVPALQAHDQLRRLPPPRQRCERRVQLQHQPVQSACLATA